jgi:hypothetical protein
MMRSVCFALMCLLVFSAQAAAQVCTSIKDGVIVSSGGDVLKPGYDQWGYNYQARGYNGIYDNISRPAVPYTEETCETAPFGCTSLSMKWNDAWLSNRDCDGDLLLDRPATYKGSGAWITNHMAGTYEYVDDNGRTKEAHWTWFTKIVAVPADAVQCVFAVWCQPDGTRIGFVIWGDFATVESIYNDPVGGFHGREFLSPAHPGLGLFKP